MQASISQHFQRQPASHILVQCLHTCGQTGPNMAYTKGWITPPWPTFPYHMLGSLSWTTDTMEGPVHTAVKTHKTANMCWGAAGTTNYDALLENLVSMQAALTAFLHSCLTDLVQTCLPCHQPTSICLLQEQSWG